MLKLLWRIASLAQLRSLAHYCRTKALNNSINKLLVVSSNCFVTVLEKDERYLVAYRLQLLSHLIQAGSLSYVSTWSTISMQSEHYAEKSSYSTVGSSSGSRSKSAV
ncbi:Hypothetical_protein [Hexamita inflata]|uniref:Hypothetical_protein n=1 Tax=Hexamita inflata TaxID=28002 RepID=A0AA86VBW5_9EUKA|nr:Hypothetical protein HINF_LOCUS49938 [Hexamita inflata]